MEEKNHSFDQRWQDLIKQQIKNDEFSIFVAKGDKPITQRQFNLFNYFEYIKKVAKKYNGHKALEVGCGRGTMSLYLNKYLGMDVTLVDSSEKSIVLAKQNFVHFSAQGKFLQEDVQNLSLEDNSFDLVISIGLTEHFDDYDKVYAEQHRVLKPGGVMISLNIPKKHSIQALNTAYRKIRGVVDKKLRKDYYRNSDKPEDYRKGARKAGFKEVETFYVNPFPLFTPLGPKAEKIITGLYKGIYNLRRLFIKYPFKGSRACSQAHFLIGKK